MGSLCSHEGIPFNLIAMMKTKPPINQTGERQPYRMRLPGFVTEKEVGLGDVIKRATSAVGMRPCGGCKGRAATLNRWFVFTRWHSS